MRGNTYKSPIKLNAVENKLAWRFVYEWENLHGKNSTG